MDLREAFEALVHDHDGRPRNEGVLPTATHSAEGYNPICGDRYRIYLRIEDGVVRASSFEGRGCAMSKASASILTGLLEGRSVSDAGRLLGVFREALVTGGMAVDRLSTDLRVLAAVRRIPARVKCVLLPWHAARAALEGNPAVSTESPADAGVRSGGDASSG